MKSKQTLPILLLCGAAVGSITEAKPAQRPNIVLINVDDLGWTDMSFMGSTLYETPNIDRLYQKGAYFSNGYSSAANSAPSRACMLSGQFSPRHGVFTVGRPTRGDAKQRKLIPIANSEVLPKDAVTLAQTLKNGGYTTCNIGKWHVGEDPTKQGIDINVAGSDAGAPKTGGYFSPYKVPNIKSNVDGEYLTDRLGVEAANFVNNVSKESPFFLYYAPYAVHAPLMAKPEMIEKYKAKERSKDGAHFNAIYAAMVESMDESIGTLMEAIERNGYAKNTLIIFTSDNGGVYNISKQHPLRAGKGSYYEGGIRVPIIVYMDGKFDNGLRSDTPVTNLDFFPTILEFTGVKAESKLDGTSLLPLLSGKPSSELTERDLHWFMPAYIEAKKGDTECRDQHFRTRPVSVIRRGDWKLIENFEDGSLELYNLTDDLGERTNLSDKNPQKRDELYRAMKQWQADVKAPIPTVPNPEYNPTAKK